MAGRGLLWFLVLAMCLLVHCGLPEVPEPAQCLVSGIYSLIRAPESQGEQSCYRDCFEEPDCHMAVVTRPLRGPQQCLLVNCLNQGQHEYPRDRGVQIRVYPKSTISSERRASLTKFIRSGDDETHRCFDIMQNGSCRSGIPKFFYNSTSSRCERFFTGCGSNRNTFDTQQACDALCSQKFLCYRPMERGQRPPLRFSDPTDDLEIGPPNFFFYNISSSKCEAFYFRGSASNGNIFRTERECESFCGGVQAPSASRPADSEDVFDDVSCVCPRAHHRYNHLQDIIGRPNQHWRTGW